MTQSSYLPLSTMLESPYPIKALDLWFALRWLGGKSRNILVEHQRKAHACPPTEEANTEKLPMGISGHVLFGLQPPWIVQGLAIRMPEVYQRVSHIVNQRQLLSAGKLFAEMCDKELKRRNLHVQYKDGEWVFGAESTPKYDVFAIWAGLVQRYSDASTDNFFAYCVIAQYHILHIVASGGKEEAQKIVEQICSAIEINFKD